MSRELDAMNHRIAMQVMDWKRGGNPCFWYSQDEKTCTAPITWSPATDIAAAMEVVNARCWTDKDGCSRVYWRFWNTPFEWFAEIRKCGKHMNQIVWKHEASAEALPGAICKAALEARK